MPKWKLVLLPFLFALTLFVSATLLFLVQPMVAKMILPLLGGSPAVWNTCMVFFQAALLGGYLYAHLATTWLGVRSQAFVHIVLLILPLVVLPVVIAPTAAESLSPEANPIPWVFTVLLVSVGLPFFVTATTAPLLQKWFADTGHPSAGDPYFLYGASNVGSMLALICYPLLLEPNLRLAEQRWLWAVGYGVLIVLVICCAALQRRKDGRMEEWKNGSEEDASSNLPTFQSSNLPTLEPSTLPSGDPPTLLRCLRWIGLAFAPSSLMLGVTTYMTTDIAAIPLLWVIPLAIYLLTFILVFARWTIIPHAWVSLTLPIVVLAFPIMTFVSDTSLAWIPFHLLVFFVASLFCHGELAKDRPSPRYLTLFYLCMSLGGVLGGMFNALVAPLIFSRLTEYSVALILACLLRPSRTTGKVNPLIWLVDVGLPVGVGLMTAGLSLHLPKEFENFGSRHVGFLLGGLGLLGYSMAHLIVDRPISFALTLAAILFAKQLSEDSGGHVVHRDRSFFGVLSVTTDEEHTYHKLIHGSTLHGQQSLLPQYRYEPLTYYHRNSPIGQMFEVFNKRPGLQKVASVGLGTGTLTSYARPNQDWTIYEIDPAVERIANNEKLFTYLQDEEAGRRRIVMGDARLRLKEAPDGAYGLIILDAFSSDAIPIHLLTWEALQLYLAKLADGGVIAFHTSNRYLNLDPVVSTLARDAGLQCLIGHDSTTTEDEKLGKSSSNWLFVARRLEDFGKLAQEEDWKLSEEYNPAARWTDDFSNIISVFRWPRRQN